MRTSTRILLVGLAGAGLVLAGCGGNGEEQVATTEGAGYEDGVYFAQAEFSENSGWKDVVVFEVEDGEITMVEWNAAHEQNGPPKDTRSRQGDYGMVENSDATLHWYEQAEATEQWLIENQDIDQLELDDEGRPDAISQATIRVGGFKSLVQEALDTGPVGYGMWEDGTYSAEQEEFSDNGWKATVAITVITRDPRIAPVMSVSITRFTVDSGSSQIGFIGCPTPALLIHTSTRPNARAAALQRRSRSSVFVTSPASNATRSVPYSERSRSAVAASASNDLPLRVTPAPNRKKLSASPNPIPLLLPVITNPFI